MKVSKRSRGGMRSVFAFLFSLMLAFAPAANAQQCLSDPDDQAIGGTRPSSDGKTHVKYRFRDENGNAITPDASMTTAMQQGAQRWNAQSGTTKVVFEAAGPNDYADIIVIPSSDPNKSGGCGGMDTLLGYLYYDPSLVTAAQSSTANAATVIAHELGHYLGLDDAGANPNPPTIMNNPGPGMSCTNFTVPTTSPTSSDATKAAQCTQAARLAQFSPNGGGGGHSGYIYKDPGLQCFARYEVTDYYYCTSDGGCSYMYSSWDYLGTYCY